MKTLTATKRNKETSLKVIRAEENIPGVVYKNGMENILVTVPNNVVRSLWKDIKDKQEFTLDIEGVAHTVVLQDIQVHVVSGEVLHMDFLVK